MSLGNRGLACCLSLPSNKCIHCNAIAYNYQVLRSASCWVVMVLITYHFALFMTLHFAASDHMQAGACSFLQTSTRVFVALFFLFEHFCLERSLSL